jgi:hypothetical protein
MSKVLKQLSSIKPNNPSTPSNQPYSQCFQCPIRNNLSEFIGIFRNPSATFEQRQEVIEKMDKLLFELDRIDKGIITP